MSDYEIIKRFLDKRKQICEASKHQCTDCPLEDRCNIAEFSQDAYDAVMGQSPWDSVAIDTPVTVWNDKYPSGYYRGHFAGYRNGKVMTWKDGMTSWTANYCYEWDHGEVAGRDDKAESDG